MRRGVIILLFSLLPMTAWAEAHVVRGQDIFEGRCQACHQTPKPKALSMSQWRAVLQTMQVRMQQKSMDPLSDQEMADVLLYLAEAR